jgi:hypothetical protein
MVQEASQRLIGVSRRYRHRRLAYERERAFGDDCALAIYRSGTF